MRKFLSALIVLFSLTAMSLNAVYAGKVVKPHKVKPRNTSLDIRLCLGRQYHKLCANINRGTLPLFIIRSFAGF